MLIALKSKILLKYVSITFAYIAKDDILNIFVASICYLT